MKFFKLNNVKRIIILGTTLVATIIAIVFGSLFYVGKDVKKSVEYSGGYEYTVQIQTPNNSSGLSDQVAQSIYDRIDSLGVGGAKVESGKNNDGGTVRVRYPGLTSQSDVDQMQKLITEKPHLVFTDIYGNTLFDEDGHFNRALRNLNGQVPSGQVPGAYGTENYKRSRVPLESGGAKNIFTQNGENKVEISLDSARSAREWFDATSYVSKLGKGKNSIVAWLDINKFISEMNNWPGLGSQNPFLSAYIDNNPSKPLRKETVDAGRFLISVASVKAPLNGRSFVLEGNFTQEETKVLARKLNYGSSHYSLKFLSSRAIPATYGENAFNKAMIAGIIVFAVIAIFLIANYGLLGALSTISIGLYLFLTLLMFTVMRGEYSPATIAALIIGVGMSVDANIITFERLKSIIYSGSSVKKAHKQANRQSLSAIFDANITTLIVAFVLFYFGTRNIIGLSITLILSIIFTLIIMLGFTRVMSSVLVGTGLFENKKWLVGIKPKIDIKAQVVLNKPDYVKTSKWFSLTSLFIITIGVILFAILAGIAGSFTGGMNFSKDFTGGTDITVKSKLADNSINKSDENGIVNNLIINGVPTEDINKIYDGKKLTGISVNTKLEVNLAEINKFDTDNRHFKINANIVSNTTARKIVQNALIAIAIAIAIIVAYTLIRFKWTYSFAAIVALVHDGLIVTAIFVITRLQVSPIFVAGILSIIGYSVNDTIVTFDRIRERMDAHVGKLNDDNIKSIGNQAVKDTIKRSILTSFTTIIAILILMSFGNATKLSFNLAMLVGLLAGTYSSIFIATYLWTKMEIRRQKGINKRKKSGFWNTTTIEEQTFTGINDYRS
ncbi:protein translocase subunit SecDF [Candidatus Mycoplasma mahonii]|uniref:protein translocase subunit SecDF n=1 Tax=Candidatus Mycoplasma mahonii TaxID=3004105 RepID=UPI0026EF1EBF|nr:protein translocase subunit SecDF [Candidatus Mycoplasma mahonii]WKX02802.1 protein translocase subunit SecDF [Candidatus Mycoplasma mahonii]